VEREESGAMAAEGSGGDRALRLVVAVGIGGLLFSPAGLAGALLGAFLAFLAWQVAEDAAVPSGPALDPRRRAVSVLCLLATPLAAWFLIGDRSEPLGRDQMFTPPAIPRALEFGLGLVSAAALTVGVATLMRGGLNRLEERRWKAVFVVLAAGGVFVAYAARVITARVGGANIGGGMLLLVLPMVGVLLLWAFLRTWRLSEATERRASRPPTPRGSP
jgi:hypothetical protein